MEAAAIPGGATFGDDVAEAVTHSTVEAFDAGFPPLTVLIMQGSIVCAIARQSTEREPYRFPTLIEIDPQCATGAKSISSVMETGTDELRGPS